MCFDLKLKIICDIIVNLKPDMIMDSSFMIHDDTVVYFGEPADHYAIEVKSASLARVLKIMFNNAWNHTE
jgi:hypothetical protein